jgi:long-chain acyl-CoA synthetase
MTGSRLEFPIKTVEEVPYLKGRRLYFDSIAEMFYTRVQESPDATHVLFYDEVITYAQTNQQANRVANYLKDKGVAKGDIISVMVLKSPEIYYTMFGIQKLGAVAGAINYMLKGPEIAYVLDITNPGLHSWAVSFEDFAPALLGLSINDVVEVYRGRTWDR